MSAINNEKVKEVNAKIREHLTGWIGQKAIGEKLERSLTNFLNGLIEAGDLEKFEALSLKPTDDPTAFEVQVNLLLPAHDLWVNVFYTVKIAEPVSA